jgi:hypothetical protein
VRTNTFGWRGLPCSVEKPDNGFRVVGLGDSILFGWGIDLEATGVHVLRRRLAEALPRHAVDVIGTGVPGYNTAMEAEVLRQKLLPFRPDIVLIDFVGNDFDLPNFLLAPADFWRLDHCFLVDLARRAWRSSWLDPHIPLVWAPGDGTGHFESDPDRVPREYRHLVGPPAVRRALQSLRDLGHEHGFRVLLTTHTTLPPAAEGIRRELGLPHVDLRERIGGWMRQHGNPPFVGSALTIDAEDPHPSALVHGWWAEAVFGKLVELQWLPH